MKGRTTISYPFLSAVRTLLALSYRISLTKHADCQTPYNLTRAVLRRLRGMDDVRGAVVPMAWLQASMTLVPHVVVLSVLRTAAVFVLGCKIIGNTLTSSVTLLLLSCLRFRRPGLFAIKACPTFRALVLAPLDMIVYLCRTIASISARVMLSLYNMVRCSNS